MPRLHQVLVSASPGDAITNEAFEIRHLLRELGESEIFAYHVHPELGDSVHSLNDYQALVGGRSRRDYLFLHASIGEAAVEEFVNESPERVVMIYHNISPVESFLSHDPKFAELLKEGRESLSRLRPRVTRALADSTFNAEELKQVGYDEVRVAPLIVDFEKLHDRNPPGDDLPAEEPQKSLLMVGQLLPHKRQDLLIQAYHILTTYLVPEASLTIVGWGRLPGYKASLRWFASDLNLTGLNIADYVKDEDLDGYYRRASTFVTLSEHEGFCVPLLEAMWFDLPIVARRFGAIPETIGRAGLLLAPEDGPFVAAEAMAKLLEDEPLRRELIERGRARREQFSLERTRSIFLEHISDLV